MLICGLFATFLILDDHSPKPPEDPDKQCEKWRRSLEGRLSYSADMLIDAQFNLAHGNIVPSEYRTTLEVLIARRKEENDLAAKLRTCPERFRVDIPGAP